MNITAKLIVKEDTKTFGEKGFKKRLFVVEYAENPKYPEFIQFELIQDKCELLDDYNIGDSVNVHFNLKGREWINPKGDKVYFNTLQTWKLEKNNGTHDMTPEHTAANNIASGNDEGGLPF